MERCSICLRNETTTPHVRSQCLPVPHFGNYANAKVATIGLNPAFSFTYALQTIGDFGKQSRDELTDADLLRAAAWRKSYFSDPNREWHTYFRSLDSVLGRANWFWSYASGSAVHLDLAACATQEAFGCLGEEYQTALVSNCRQHFLANLENLPCGILLLLNGDRVYKKVREISLNTEVREQPVNEVGDRGYLGSMKLGNQDYEFRAWSKSVGSKTHPKFLTDLAVWLHCSLREQK